MLNSKEHLSKLLEITIKQNELIINLTKVIISMNANVNGIYEEVLRTKAYIHRKLDK